MIFQICQIEIKVSNIKRSLEFYEKFFAWKPTPVSIHNVFVLNLPKESPYGISLIPHEKPDIGSALTLYFKASKEEFLTLKQKAVDLRLENSSEPRMVSGYGEIFYIEDPDGHCFGIFSAFQ